MRLERAMQRFHEFAAFRARHVRPPEPGEAGAEFLAPSRQVIGVGLLEGDVLLRVGLGARELQRLGRQYRTTLTSDQARALADAIDAVSILSSEPSAKDIRAPAAWREPAWRVGRLSSRYVIDAQPLQPSGQVSA